MEKVPTAAEFLDRDESGVFTKVDIVQAMIEFTKIHVEAALKEASKAAFPDSKYDVEKSYPLDNIK
jgi:hypothetical protein